MMKSLKLSGPAAGLTQLQSKSGTLIYLHLAKSMLYIGEEDLSSG